MARALDPEDVLPRPGVRARELFLRVALLGAGVTLLGALSASPHTLVRALLVLAPLVPLLAGLYAFHRATPADGWLLFGVPSALVLGQPYAPARLDPIFFCTWAAVMLGYVVQAARLVSLPAIPEHVTRAGRPAEGLERLRHRVRFYDALLVVCALTFGYLVYRALVSSGSPLPAMAAAGVLAVLATRGFLVDALDRHLQRDPALVQSLDTLRRHAKRGRPDRSFYFVAAAALGAMALFVLRERVP